MSNFTTNVDLCPDNDLIVRAEVNLDRDTRLLTWRFTSLDPVTGEPPDDPLAGFLPPNINPPEGDGNVLFTVMPKQDLATVTEVFNKADIFFDTNAPIETPEWFNTIDNTIPISEVLPLAAAQTTQNFEIHWEGSDEGSGVRDYTIYVFEDDGPFEVWLRNTSAISEVFPGKNGKRYSFYSTARDQTNNEEAPPQEGDATTFVESGVQVSFLFEGTVVSIGAPGFEVPTLSVGDTFTGSYTIRSYTPDSRSSDPTLGLYVDAFVSLSADVGDYSMTASSNPTHNIQVGNDYTGQGPAQDYFNIVINGFYQTMLNGSDVNGWTLQSFIFQLSDPNALAISSDALLSISNPFSPSQFGIDNPRTFLSLGFMSQPFQGDNRLK